MLKKVTKKNILEALLIVVFGFVLLFLTFIFDSLLQAGILALVGLFVKINPNMELYWYPVLMHGLFIVFIWYVSQYIFRLKLSVFWKSVYLMVPTAVVLVTIGMALYQWPIALYAIGGIVALGILYRFHKTMQPWQYYVSVILPSVSLVTIMLLGQNI